MSIDSVGLVSSTALQLQARFEASQTERILSATRALGAKIEGAEGQARGTLSPAEKDAAMQKLVKVSRDFESIFLGYMLKAMRDATPKSDFMGHTREQEIFTSMQDEELAKGMAKAGGIGLSKMLVEQLKKNI